MAASPDFIDFGSTSVVLPDIQQILKSATYSGRYMSFRQDPFGAKGVLLGLSKSFYFFIESKGKERQAMKTYV